MTPDEYVYKRSSKSWWAGTFEDKLGEISKEGKRWTWYSEPYASVMYMSDQWANWGIVDTFEEAVEAINIAHGNPTPTEWPS